jgi:hypothetical protein
MLVLVTHAQTGAGQLWGRAFWPYKQTLFPAAMTKSPGVHLSQDLRDAISMVWGERMSHGIGYCRR